VLAHFWFLCSECMQQRGSLACARAVSAVRNDFSKKQISKRRFSTFCAFTATSHAEHVELASLLPAWSRENLGRLATKVGSQGWYFGLEIMFSSLVCRDLKASQAPMRGLLAGPPQVKAPARVTGRRGVHGFSPGR